MREAVKVLLGLAAYTALSLTVPFVPVAWGQTAEEIVQKQLGQLLMANANCSAQGTAISTELQKARAEIDDLKKKLAEATPAK